MAISYETYQKLLRYDFPAIEQKRTAKDTILYALSVGMGLDPMDTQQLRYVYEKDLLALPTMIAVIGMPYGWIGKSGIGFGTRSVQAEQSILFHQPVPVEGDFVGKTRITSVVDKGAGKGMLVTVERTLIERGADRLIATLTATSYCRGDGGFGGPSGPVSAPHAIPDSAPQHVCELPTSPQTALMYRLHGDPTPLHADPEFARRAGFSRPILHGLCTMGVACHALLRTLCAYDPQKLKSIECRFIASVYPGEMLRTEMWRTGQVVSFRSLVPARDNLVVVNNGRAEIAV